jgi:hypothetical protein
MLHESLEKIFDSDLSQLERELDYRRQRIENGATLQPIADVELVGELLDIVKASKSIKSALANDNMVERRRQAADEIGVDLSTPMHNRFARLCGEAKRGLLTGKGVEIDTSSARYAAWKLIFFIDEGDMSGEQKFACNQPDPPRQWLDNMSQDAANLLARMLEDNGFEFAEFDGREPASIDGFDELYDDLKLVRKSSRVKGRYKVVEAPFVMGHLETPHFIDLEEVQS